MTDLLAEPYEVFARSGPGAELYLIGAVAAANAALAATCARWLYDEESWSEMRVVRRADMIGVERDRDDADAS